MGKKRFGNELHPLYATWLTITQRCRNENHVSYKNYGALGIKLHEEIKEFKSFISYVTTLPEYSNRKKLGLTLDRIDGTKGYQKGNLRWATRTAQAINSKRRKTSKATYIGIGLNTRKTMWTARICWENRRICVGNFTTELLALAARNEYITKHSLPHKIQEPIEKSATTIL